MSNLEILFLGTGTSTGVPMIGCDCPVCKSDNPHNRRLRSSIYLTAGNLKILVDTSPDFREQALCHNIRKVDALFITHAHVDHLFGLDDIRRINTIQNASIPVWSSPEAIKDIHRIFSYVFTDSVPGTFRPKLETHSFDSTLELPQDGGESLFITPIDVVHGWARTFGYRFDYNGRSFAYIPDCHELPQAAMKQLANLDCLIVDALKYTDHPTHFSVDEALQAISKLSPKKALLTHISHRIEHESFMQNLLEKGLEYIKPAYDGLRFAL